MAAELTGLAISSAYLTLASATVNFQQAAVAIAKLQTPNAPLGINGFVFDIPLEETVTLSSSITDHFVETNVAIQDHIALNPVKITLVGNIGELVWKKDKYEVYAEQIINSLGIMLPMLPTLNQSAVEALAAYEEIKRQKQEALKVYNDFNTLFSDKPNQTKQQSDFDKLQKMFTGRTLATVLTPWATFTNMAIENMEFHQDEATKDLTTVTVTFKQIQTTAVDVTEPPKKGRAQSQQATQVKKGQVQGTPVQPASFQQTLQSIKLVAG